MPATYTGKACRNDLSYDFDYTLNLMTMNQAGLTKLNPPNTDDKQKEPRAFHTEFDSRETLVNFITTEWKELAGEQGDDCSNKPELCRVNDKRAIEIGLVGLDTTHSAYSEIHPVYALAIELDPNPSHNKWIIFARNRGDEGDCSTRDHPLLCSSQRPIEELSLFLPVPGRKLVSDAFLLEGTVFASNLKNPQNTCPIIGRGHYGNDDGVFIRIPLPDDFYEPPEDGPLVEGVISIEWHLSGNAVSSDWDAFNNLPSCQEAGLTVSEEEPGKVNKELLMRHRYLLKDLGPVGKPVALVRLSCGFLASVNHVQIPQMSLSVHSGCDRGAVNKTNRHIIDFHERLAKRNRQLTRLLKNADKK
jgi:hypothetical protein